MTRLLPRPRVALALLAGAVAVFAVLAVLVHDRGDNRVDRAIFIRVQDHVPEPVITVALRLAAPVLVVVLLAVLAGWAAVRRRWNVIVLAVAAPVTSVLLTEQLFKPWVHRTDGDYLAFPSGHETGVASVACVATVALLASAAGVRRTLAGLACLAMYVAAGALGLVGGGWHYATDTVGSLALCTAVTVLYALALDGVARRQSAPSVHPVVSKAQSGQATL